MLKKLISKLKFSNRGSHNITPRTAKNKKRTEKAENKKKDEGQDVAVKDLFRFADFIDKTLLFVGTIFALASGSFYPLLYLSYGKVAGTFIDYMRNLNINATVYNSSFFKCLFVSEGDMNYDERIASSINFFIGFGFASLLANYVASVCWATAAERQIRTIRCSLFQKVLSQEMTFFDNNTPGDITSKLTSNINALKDGIGHKFANFVALIGRCIACTILGLVVQWKFSIVYLAVTPIISIVIVCLAVSVKKYAIKEYEIYDKASKIAQDILSSIRTVYAFCLQHKKIKIYNDILMQGEPFYVKKDVISGTFMGIVLFIVYSVFGIAVYYGVYLVRTDCETYKPGLILQSFFCMFTAITGLSDAMPFLKDLAEARGAAKSVYEILDKKSEIDVKENAGKVINDFKGSIEFDNIFFNYPTRSDAKILQGFNLNISAGQKIALCGASGSGKSTIIQLLQRFYDPVSGMVNLDGQNIKGLDLLWLRNQMALVSQEPVLFALTIKENIRLGKLNATDDEIIEAAKKANAHNFIMNLNDKYETLVGERGSQLSGGQKQRIAIARALVRDPKILLLDEATSALDLESERIVQDALDKAKEGRTTIIIAHRLSTIRNADLIVAMVDGRVAEIGTHDDLMEFEGVYYELVMRQVSDFDRNKEKSSENKTFVEENEYVEDKSNLNLSEQTNEVEPGEKNSKKSSKKYSLFEVEKLLWSMSKPEIGYLILGTISQLVAGGVFPIVCFYFCEIFDVFVLPDAHEQDRESLKLMGIILGVAFAGFIAYIFLSYGFSVSSIRLTKRLRVTMLTNILRQDIAWHDLDDNRSGILSTRLAASVPLCKGLTVNWLGLMSEVIASNAVSIIISFVLNWKLAFVMVSFVPLNFGAAVMSARASMNSNIKGKTAIEEAGKLATECVENIKTLTSLGREDFFQTLFKNIFKRKFKRTLASLHIQAIFYSISNAIIFFIQASAFGYGFQLLKNKEIELTPLYQIYAVVTFSSMILGRLYSQLPDQNKARQAAKTALEILHTNPKIDSMSEEGLKPTKIKGEIKFHDVHFKYPTRGNKILKGINLTINPDETTALVGQSGCGKSTIIQLLLRFYDVDGGKITFDGVDIRGLNIKWLRSQIGLVSQEPVLFNCSIFENIRYGDIERTDIKLDDVMDVAKQANIHPKIENLPEKYDTIVGTKGGQLSGGEKQRVAIARALIRKPKILLLDEATSALDAQSEHIVQDALDKAQIGRTCISIAHRLSTIQNAPKICVFKDGQISEEGSHSVLMNNKSIYYTLQNNSI